MRFWWIIAAMVACDSGDDAKDRTLETFTDTDPDTEGDADTDVDADTDTDTDGDTDTDTEVPSDVDLDGFTTESGDCDDGNAAVFPGATERCNDIDDDCDLAIDEDAVDAVTGFTDADGDGFGDDAAPVVVCTLGAEAPVGGDCDEADAAVYPGAPDVACDARDNDCDPATFEAGSVTLDGVAQADLRTALAAAADGATISLCEGQYPLAQFELTRTVTVTGAGAPELTVLRGTNGALFHVRGGAPTFANLTLTNGSGHPRGGDTEGGAIRVDGGATVKLDGALITGNEAGYGAGVWLGVGCTLDAVDSHIVGNSGDPGGAIITEGGGIYAEQGAVVTLDGSHVDGNDAGLCGGVSLVEDGAIYGSNASTISDNEATSLQAGGVCAWQGAEISGVDISRNIAGNIAGGIYAASGLTLTDATLTGNVSGLTGGGIDANGDLVLTRVVLDGNEGGIDGGAIALNGANLDLVDCTVTGNFATFFAAVGGGVLLTDATMTATGTEWGTGATDNAPADIGLGFTNTSFSYAGVVDITCSDDAGTCM